MKRKMSKQDEHNLLILKKVHVIPWRITGEHGQIVLGSIMKHGKDQACGGDQVASRKMKNHNDHHAIWQTEAIEVGSSP